MGWEGEKGWPMKILGISASYRKWGNTDILVWHALKGARCEGSEIRFLRLTDLEIRQCTGCFACMLKSVDCVQDDHFPALLSAMRWADGVILGSPVYLLCSAGSIQTMIPRFFRMGYTEEFKDKPGLALVAAGGPGWDTFAVPQVSLFFRFLGMPVLDHVVGHGQGPGEVFYDEKACIRAVEGGAGLARGETEFRGDPGTCPACHFDLVVTRPDGSAYCVLCDLFGQWVEEGGARRFEPVPGESSRMGPGEMRKHFEESILTSAERFRSRRQDIRERLKRFQVEIAAHPVQKGRGHRKADER